MVTGTTDRAPAWLYGVVAILCVGILLYSQTTTLDWDEGFHLLAASLIAAGKRPYLDFCFPQPWLHAWWNSLWLYLTGGSWRGPHAIAALLICGAIAMTVDFVYRRCPIGPGRAASACAAALLLGLNPIVWEFGTTAQAYGACTFLTVAAFRAALSRRPLLAGCLAGAAAGCSLLTAPFCIVLLLWSATHRRWRDAAVFLSGTLFAALPLLFSFVRAPYPTWFNLVEFHVFFRHAGWTSTNRHDLLILTSWTDSAPALLLGLLALAGLWWVRQSRPEFQLAGWLAAALALEAAVAHPTFPQYFICVVPFLAMPAAVGFSAVAAKLSAPLRWATPALAAMLLLSLINSVLNMRDTNNTWTTMDWLARKIEQVTPPHAAVLADPPVYFALHRLPPSGMEFPASHAVELPADKAALLHIVPQSTLEQGVRSGEFATAETCKGDEDEIKALNFPKLYTQSASLEGCTVYWGLATGVLSYK